MHIRNYEIPDGRSKGQPELLVSRHVIEKMGMPAVNYDGLHQFLTDDLEIPQDRRTYIKLYGRFSDSIIGGYHVPYSRTVHVNPLMAEQNYPHKGGTMNVLSHELRHRSDSTNRKAMTAVDIAARWASYKIGLEVSDYVPLLKVVPTLGAVVTRQIWYVHEPAEKRARAQQRKLEDSPHQYDILFPRSARTLSLAVSGRLPESIASQFGLNELNEIGMGLGFMKKFNYIETTEHLWEPEDPSDPQQDMGL